MLVRISDRAPVPVPYVDDEGVQYQPGFEALWSDAELAAIGLARAEPPGPARDALKAYAAQVRRAVMAGAVLRIGGLTFSPTPDNLTALESAARSAQRAPGRSFVWAQKSGSVDISSEQVLALADAADAFIQVTFATLAEIYAGIDAGGVTRFSEIDAYPWPKG